jgi:hypothetical protein
MGYIFNPFTGTFDSSGGGTGDVVGPASSTDNAVAVFDGTTGKLIQNSTITVDGNSFSVSSGQSLNLNVGGLVGLTVNSSRDVIANNSARVADYLGVGSTAAPTNTTSGDLTFVRGFGTSMQLSGLTASTALVTDGSKNLASSAVTATELGYLSGVTSALQTQLNGKLGDTGDTGSGDYAFSGYLRVGSTSAPTNTTAGDITGVRLSLGNAALSTANGMFIAATGTLTDISGTRFMDSSNRGHTDCFTSI